MNPANDVAKRIDTYAYFIPLLGRTCQRFRIYPLNASPFYNFRDALFHYILYCEADDDDARRSQRTSIEEHLFRGAKDMFVILLYGMKQKVLIAFQGSTLNERRRDLRKLLHEYKKLELTIRTDAELVFSRDFGVSFISRITELITETRAVFSQHDLDFPEDKD